VASTTAIASAAAHRYDAVMTGVPRLLAAAFLTDASLYLAFAALPFRAIDLGAGPARLGILPTLYAGAYMFSASLGGRLSDRLPRLVLARRALLLFSAGCVALALAPGSVALYAALPLLGAALGFFWSPLQAALSDRCPLESLPRAIAAFNVSWSLGKGTGLVLGGMLTEALRPEVALLVAALPPLAIFAVLPRSGPASAPADPRLPEVPSRAPAFLPLAWITNALAFGTAGTLNMHAPRLLLERGAGPTAFGVMLGSVFVVQTATFALLSRRRPSPSGLFAAYGLALAGLTLFVTTAGSSLRVAAALPLGAAFGLAYHASIQASLERPSGRGRAAGWHETILGAGSSSLPLLGGLAASARQDLAAPFVVAGVLLAGGLGISAQRLLLAGKR
jgi:predicted MFS family arabinose efflux permease